MNNQGLILCRATTTSRSAVGPASCPKDTENSWPEKQSCRCFKLIIHLYLVTKVKNVWSYTFIPPCVLIAWCLIKNTVNFDLFYKKIFILLRKKRIKFIKFEWEGVSIRKTEGWNGWLQTEGFAGTDNLNSWIWSRGKNRTKQNASLETPVEL
jgi:hypothetical protein